MQYGQHNVQIANGQTQSNGLPVDEAQAGALHIPAGWTGGTTIALEGSFDNVNWYPLVSDTGTQLALTGVAAGEIEVLPAGAFTVPWLRFVSAAVSRDETLRLGTQHAA